MKKSLFVIIAGFVLAACSKVDDRTPGTYTFSMEASMDTELTKTAYAGETTFSWSTGDQISVLFHNGETHQFFTLTNSVGDLSTFTGEITEGYVLGASPKEGGVKWALFPAGSHTWNTTNHRPNFNIPAETDFTASHFSANIPMYARGDASNHFAFKHSAGAYKFTFSDLDVSKVKLTITHNLTHALSGSFPVREEGDWEAKYASAGSEAQSVSYIANVSSKTATFYFTLPWDNESGFQPVITLRDANTGYYLYHGTAKDPWVGGSAAAEIRPSKNRMVVLPAISASGTGVPFISSYGVDWANATYSAAGNTNSGNDAVKVVKVEPASSYVYVYVEVDGTKVHSNDSYYISNRSHLYLADGTEGTGSNWTQNYKVNVEAWLKQYGDAIFYLVNNASVLKDSAAMVREVDNTIYIEMAVDRSQVSFLQNDADATRYFAFLIEGTYKETSSSSTVYTGNNGYAPLKGGSMLSVTVPKYVAP